MNEVEIIEKDIVDLTERGQQGGLLEASADNILYMAEKAEQYITAMNKIMTAALKITTESDWVLIGGTPYLQESGATKVARLFGISWQLVGNPEIVCDPAGYKTFTYRARFFLKNQFVEAEGSRSMRDEFFSGKGCSKKPDEIDERDVKQSAFTNCINTGIKRLIPGLRGLDVKTLASAGFNVENIRGYTFRTGSKGGNSGNAADSGLVCSKCNKPINQTVASFSQGKYGALLCIDCQKEASK